MSPEGSEAQNRTFCSSMQPSTWKHSSPGNYVTLKTPELSSTWTPHPLAKEYLLAIPSSDSGSLRFILYENKQVITTDFPCSSISDPNLLSLNVAHFFLDFLLLPPLLNRQLFPYDQMRYIYGPSDVYHTYFCLLKLFKNPAQWSNTNRKLSKVVHPHY